LRDVTIPALVPLYRNLDFFSQIGWARLRPRDGKIYAAIELMWSHEKFDDADTVILGYEETEKVLEDGCNYLVGGSVSCASLITKEFIEQKRKV
jgi:hypothetical protein